MDGQRVRQLEGRCALFAAELPRFEIVVPTGLGSEFHFEEGEQLLLPTSPVVANDDPHVAVGDVRRAFGVFRVDGSVAAVSQVDDLVAVDDPLRAERGVDLARPA